MESNAEEQIKLKLLKTYINREVPNKYKKEYLNIVKKGVNKGKSANNIRNSLISLPFFIGFNFTKYHIQLKNEYNNMVKRLLNQESSIEAMAEAYILGNTFDKPPNNNNLNSNQVVENFRNILAALVRNSQVLNGMVIQSGPLIAQ